MRIQMLIPLAVLALIVLSPAAHAQTPGVTGADLMNDCRNYPDSKRPRNCELFAGAFAEIARSTDRAGNPRGRLCIGEDVPVADVIALINNWLAKHPNTASMNGYEIAYSATQDRYRCK